ncbi:hypothetical protein AMAG_16523 [Allomyces macrogynus ATCC 38327]|uniref:Uncharacterized protein n=1 Tax=Allomyces macrogynus (strain ATCC 38327) TaxID=578462 RepID=A0A0L0TD81_ALLM3|nr:hypothetical protein AMAG_16523 [Allomyces macrogynus ATCC 38327]|eukprot:KNE72479.1 hypothetical protein AMAG_16523 [Allomyces macrogynus ATCC 38327]
MTPPPRLHGRVARVFADRRFKYLLAAILAALIITAVTLLALWFTKQPLFLVPTIVRPVTQQDQDAMQWIANGTVVAPMHPWSMSLILFNPNPYQMIVSDLDMTVTFAGPSWYHVPFGTAHLRTDASADPSIRIPSRIAFGIPGALNVRWDLADDAQARALGALLVVCGVSTADLPRGLHPLSHPPPLDASGADHVSREGLTSWRARVGKVTGMLGIDVTTKERRVPWPDEIDRKKWDSWCVGVSELKSLAITAVMCPDKGVVPEHVAMLANVTVKACEATGKCRG